MNSVIDLPQRLTRVALVLSLAGFTALSGGVFAQEKGAERLAKLQRIDTQADLQKVEAGDTVLMSCPKCKDTWVTIVRETGKAVQSKETKTVLRHECPGCSTKIVTTAAGKQSKAELKHVCKNCGSEDAFCCVMKKGGAPTGGMQKAHGNHH